MKLSFKIGLSVAMVAVAAAMVGVGIVIKPDLPTLHVYTWSDYMDPELIQKFETTHDCKVVVDTFDDNESMLAKLMSGATGYDIIFPSSYVVPVLKKNGLIAELDLNQLPNVVGNFDNKYKALFHQYTMKYSVPYALSITGIAYRKDVVNPDDPVTGSWNDLFNPVFRGRLNILRDIREMVGIGLIMTGHSVNSTVPDDVVGSLEYISGIKRVANKMDNEAYRVGLASGELYASIGYSTDVLQLVYDGEVENVEFVVPKEGSTCCWDEMVVTRSSHLKGLAHAFIDFFYIPEIAAQNMAYICATVPNVSMWEHVEEKYRDDPLVNVTPEILSRLELIQDIGSDIEVYNKVWDVFTNLK